MCRAGPALAAALGLTVVAWIGPAAVAQALLPAPEFHHLHLNSVNPEAAIDFYTRQFPTTSKDTFAGQPALKSPTDVLILFTRVATPPATEPPTAFWHFGWHVTDVRASLERFKQQGVDPAAALPRGGRRNRVRQQRHLARYRRPARADQGGGCRGEGQGRAAGGRRRLRLPAWTGRCAHRVPGQPAPRALQPHPHVPGAAVLRTALVSAALESAAAGRRRPGRGAAAHRGHLPRRAQAPTGPGRR